jgi:hypothetical protein
VDPGADLLHPHGRQWHVEQNGLTVDEQDVASMNPRMEWSDNEGATSRNELGYFLHFFPLSVIDRTISLTNAKLRRRGFAQLRGSGGGRQELLQFIGLMMALALHPKKSQQECFATDSEHEFNPSPNLSRWMTIGRFSHLLSCTTHATKPATDQERQEQGAFWAVQPLVDAFNEQRRRLFRSGKKCCADESIFAWRGKDQRHSQNGCPHCAKILRKPESVGMEVKNMCCCTTGIMMAMELVAGKTEMRQREWAAEHGAGTSLLLRLTKGIQTSGRIVVADSAFASVKSAVALKEKGLHFMGLVKTAHRECPKAYLQGVDMDAWGDHVLCTTTIDGSKIRAVLWNEGKRVTATGRINRKIIVVTCGTTVAAPPHQKRMWRNNEDDTTTPSASHAPTSCRITLTVPSGSTCTTTSGKVSCRWRSGRLTGGNTASCRGSSASAKWTPSWPGSTSSSGAMLPHMGSSRTISSINF